MLNHLYHLDENVYNDIIIKIKNSSKYFIEFKDKDKLGLINEIIEPFKENKKFYYYFAAEVCKKYFHKGLEYYNQNNEIFIVQLIIIIKIMVTATLNFWIMMI